VKINASAHIDGAAALLDAMTVRQKYYAEAQTAPEGYGYYKIPEGTPAGLYCVRTSGYSFIIDIIE